MLQAYEGYIEKGRIYPLIPIINTQNRRRVVITVLDEPYRDDANSTGWLDEFNRLLDESGDDLLDIKDFPRCDFMREHIEV